MTSRDWRRGLAVVALRWTTIAVFCLAAWGKLLEPTQVGHAVQAALPWLGGAARPVGWGLIAAELAVVVCLAGPQRLLGAALAAMLASGFALLTAVRLGMGATSDCGCFGVFIALTPHATLVLDLALLASSVVLLSAELPGLREPQLPTAATGANGRRLLGVAAVVGLTALGLTGWLIQSSEQSWRKHNAMLLLPGQTATLKMGRPAPPIDWSAVDSERVGRPAGPGRWRLLVFVESKCAPCRDELRGLLPRAAAWSDKLVMTVVSPAPRRAVLHGLEELEDAPVEWLRDPGGTVTRQFVDRPARSPSTVLCDPDGRVWYVGQGFAGGDSSTSSVIGAWLEDREYRDPGLGWAGIWHDRRPADAPVVIDGTTMLLSALGRGRVLVLSMVDANCGACAPHLEAVGAAVAAHPELPITRVTIVKRPDQVGQMAKRLEPGVVVASAAGNALREAYGPGLPSTAVIASGRIRYLSGRHCGLGELGVCLDELSDQHGTSSRTKELQP